MIDRHNPFVLTEDHIKLLRRMYVGWQYCETGAPEIDPKRPYGNSDVVYDIAEILGWDLFTDHNDEQHLSTEQYEIANRLHQETQTALQIVLSTLDVEPGTYRLDTPYGKDWRRIS